MKNDTKRRGETPEFDEHANEEGYFAAKEHDLVEGMKAEYLKERAARRAVQMATCPKCLGKFQKYPLLGLILDRCENCEGIWLHKGQLDSILRQQARGPLGMFYDRCFGKIDPSSNH
jgi:Zn-finger nucleic acid-binding protein